MQKLFLTSKHLSRQKRFLLVSSKSFGQMVNWETDQPPKEGTVREVILDTHMANSKYYNPHTFDP